jgi:hypothetical protein
VYFLIKLRNLYPADSPTSSTIIECSCCVSIWNPALCHLCFFSILACLLSYTNRANILSFYSPVLYCTKYTYLLLIFFLALLYFTFTTYRVLLIKSTIIIYKRPLNPNALLFLNFALVINFLSRYFGFLSLSVQYLARSVITF